MTYAEKHKALINKINEKWDKLHRVSRELSDTYNTPDIDHLHEYDRAYKNWEEAARDYDHFRSLLLNRKVNLNDTIDA